MRRFFCDGISNDGTVRLTGTEARHMREVLRMEVGQEAELFDGTGNSYGAFVEQIGGDFVIMRLAGKISENNEPKLNVTLYLAHTKGERLDFAVQKAVEIGAHTIRLFACERCVAVTNPNKLARLNRIALEASKQSGRSCLVGVEDSGSMQNALTMDTGAHLKLFCYELERVSIRERLEGVAGSVSVMCGPEGGFTPREAETAQDSGWSSVSLGGRVLRAETAPLVALSVLLYESRDI